MRIFLNRDQILIIVLVILILCPFALLRYFNISGAVPTYIAYNDIIEFEDEAHSGLPYIETEIEYPVLTGLFIYSTGILGQTKESFFIVNWILLTLCAIVTSLILYKMTSSRKRITFILILAPSFILFTVYNWDIFGIMLMLISFYFIQTKRDTPAAIFLSLAVCAKFFPIIFLVPFLLKRNKQQIMKILLVFVITFFLVNAYFMIANFSNWFSTYSFHIVRAANIDSIWGLLSLISPSDIFFVNVVFTGLFVFFYFFILYKRRNLDFFRLSFLLMLVFLIFNKVFSPQYLLWLLPFFVVIYASADKKFYSFEFSNLWVFFAVMAFYVISPDFLLLTEAGVLIRHIILVYIMCYYFKTMK